jgi:hypothetical protein
MGSGPRVRGLRVRGSRVRGSRVCDQSASLKMTDRTNTKIGIPIPDPFFQSRIRHCINFSNPGIPPGITLRPLCNYHMSLFSQLKPKPSQQTSNDRKWVIAWQLALMCCTDLMPFDVVQKTGFCKFLLQNKVVKDVSEIPAADTLAALLFKRFMTRHAQKSVK